MGRVEQHSISTSRARGAPPLKPEGLVTTRLSCSRKPQPREIRSGSQHVANPLRIRTGLLFGGHEAAHRLRQRRLSQTEDPRN
jgi:hypothetical protein